MARKIALAAIAVVVVILIIAIVLFIIPPEWRVALRDIAIIFLVVLGIVVTILTAILVAALVVVVLLIRDKIIPMLEQLTQTANQVRGTTEFVSEEVVQPIIQVAGSIARVKAMAQTAFSRDRK